MCETFTFYYICGHVASHHSINCSTNIHARVEDDITAPKRGPPFPRPKYGPAPPRLSSPMSSCADAPTIKFLGPTLCKVCIKNGEVNEYLKHVPEEEFTIFRSWKETLRLEKLGPRARDGGLAAWDRFEHLDTPAEDTSSAESMEYISPTDASRESSAERSSKSSASEPGTRHDCPLTTKKPPRGDELSALMTRIAALKGRAQKAVTLVM